LKKYEKIGISEIFQKFLGIFQEFWIFEKKLEFLDFFKNFSYISGIFSEIVVKKSGVSAKFQDFF
jgi:hypothetical protein